jgi:hypothetical protein
MTASATPHGSRVGCHDCPSAGGFGKDDATGLPIAWCRAKGCVVAPERGCDRHPLYYATRRLTPPHAAEQQGAASA